MMMSMYSAVSGLKSQQTKLNVIGNNVANINTLGYKGQNVGFSDLLSQTVSSASAARGNQGGTNAKQIGLGTQVASITTNMGVGSAQYTGSDTDAALSGAGFFIVQGGGTGKYQFTRAGNFGVDVDGNLVVNGMKVCGWNDYTIDSNGDVTYGTQSDVVPINVFDTATRTVEKAAVDAAASTRAVVRGTLAGALGDAVTQPVDVYYSDGATPPTITPATVNVTLTRVAASGGASATWHWTTTGAGGTLPSGDLNFDGSGNLITTGADASDTTGTLQFGAAAPFFEIPLNLANFNFDSAAAATAAVTYGLADGNAAAPASTTTTVVNKQVLSPEATTAAKLSGNLDTATTGATTTITMYDSLGSAHEVKVAFAKTATTNEWSWTASSTDTSVSVIGSGTLTFNANGTVTSGGSGNIGVLTTNGSDPINAKIDFSGIAQFATSKGTSSVTVASIDGYTGGTLQDFSIGTDGVIMGSYSNGQKQPLGDLGLAVFTNPQGLEKIGDNLYVTTVNSGSYTGAVEVGSNGAGGLTTGALEMSNVDLASEFSEMMITQRAYQANSKIITTSDTLLETLINMSR